MYYMLRKYLKVLPTCATPDHSIISIKIDMLDFVNNKDCLEINGCDVYDFPYSKKYKVNRIPNDFMTDCNITNEVTEYIRESISKVPSQESIDQLYEKFIQVHEIEMENKLNKIKNNPNKHSTRHRKPPFWHSKLEELYIEACRAEKDFYRCSKSQKTRRSLKDIYKAKQADFDKTYRKLKRQYVRQK